MYIYVYIYIYVSIHITFVYIYILYTHMDFIDHNDNSALMNTGHI